MLCLFFVFFVVDVLFFWDFLQLHKCRLMRIQTKNPAKEKNKTEKLLGVVKRLVAAAAELFASSQWD